MTKREAVVEIVSWSLYRSFGLPPYLKASIHKLVPEGTDGFSMEGLRRIISEALDEEKDSEVKKS